MTQPMSTDRLSALRQTFEAMLNAGALRWERDPDEDLRFFIGSSVFYLLFDATDPTYVRLTMPRFFSVAKDPSDLNRAYRICNLINSRIKLAHVALQAFEDPHRLDAVAMVEFLVMDPAEFHTVALLRMAACLQSAAQAYVQELVNGD